MISDLIELELCSNLEKLDLSFNKIEEEDNLYFLSNLSNLKILNLRENPINYSNKYIQLINEFLPNLESLDVDSIIDDEVIVEIKEELVEDKNQTEETNENENTLNKDEPFKNKILKPVIIKKVCDVGNIVKFRGEDEKHLANEIKTNLEKNNKVKIKIKNEIHKS
jgi:hypothetical protein